MLQTGIQSREVLNRRIVFRGEEQMSGRSHHQFVACYLFVFLIVAATAASAQRTPSDARPTKYTDALPRCGVDAETAEQRLISDS